MPTRMSKRICPNWPPTSAMFTCATAIGISRPCRNCCNWPRCVWNGREGSRHENPATFSELLQAYFTDRLMRATQRQPTHHRKLPGYLPPADAFAQRCLEKASNRTGHADLDAPFIVRFLDHLEKDRGNSPRSRNVRLAAIHSFFNYVALQEPAARRGGPACLGNPEQTLRKKAGGLLDADRK